MTKQVRGKCLEYNFDKIERVSQSYLQDVFKLFYILTPGDAWFQTVIKVNRLPKNPNSIFSIYDDIVRISPYGNQSNCVDEPVLRNFCFCENVL